MGHPLCSAEFGLMPKIGTQATYDGTDGAVAMALLMLEARALVEGIISSSGEESYSHDDKIKICAGITSYSSGHHSDKAYKYEQKAQSKHIAALRMAKQACSNGVFRSVQARTWCSRGGAPKPSPR